MRADEQPPDPLNPGPAVIEPAGLAQLLQALADRDYRLMGPRKRESAIVCDEIVGLDDLPAGWTHLRSAATYRLERRQDGALFGYTTVADSWKRLLYPPQVTLVEATRHNDGIEFTGAEEALRPLALIGLRACDLEAMATLDQVLLGGPFVDGHYQRRRGDAFIVAVNCGQADDTCFCASVDSGPRARGDHDLALTELDASDSGNHRFLVEVGSPRGLEVLEAIDHRPATRDDLARADEVLARATAQMGRALETSGLKALLYGQHDADRWDDVAARCLCCGNCTMVCPTCFCTTVVDRTDVTDLAGARARRDRLWDSCFTGEFSYIHGGSVRHTPRSRYRQWMTHKLASWQDQFGRLGCVGCGRCITWCPVGIDITEEAAALRAAAMAPGARGGEG
jgi:ferredoxin